MKQNTFLTKVIIIYFFLTAISLGNKMSYFDEGKKLYDKKNFEESKILFEKDIVFNPKSEKSYLYLAKIFNQNENDQEEEVNLLNVLLLNPQNEEAVFMLALLKIKQSNYNEAKDLIEKFDLVCNIYCEKKNEINEKFSKLTP